jgi:hypothetical protein
MRATAVALGALAVAGCAVTTYRPVEPRPVMGPGVQVDIVSIRGAAHEAELAIRVQQPTLIGPVSLSTADKESCSAPGALPVGYRTEGSDFSPIDDAFEVNRAEVVFVELPSGAEIARPGLFLDVKVDTASEQGCLRMPLTAAGAETLWRAERMPWTLSAGLRFDTPLSSLEGTGSRLSAEFRVLFPVGPLRLLYGLTFGGATCRDGGCPSVGADSNDGAFSGLFGHAGAELGVERRMAIGPRWSLAVTAGGSISIFHLGAPSDYMGERDAGVAGPFASLTLFVPRPDIVPGFAPTARRGAHGPELFIQRVTAWSRGPTESAWVAGFGWRVEGTQ